MCMRVCVIMILWECGWVFSFVVFVYLILVFFILIYLILFLFSVSLGFFEVYEFDWLDIFSFEGFFIIEILSWKCKVNI